MPTRPVARLLLLSLVVVPLAACVDDAGLEPRDPDLDEVGPESSNDTTSGALRVGGACPSMPMITSRVAPVPGTTKAGLPLPYASCNDPAAATPTVRTFTAATCASNASCRNVTAFRAIPDDDGDDTAAIQAAIDATPNGGTVYLPAGRYVINKSVAQVHLNAGRGIAPTRYGLQLRGRTDLHFVGDGDAATVLEDAFSQDAFDAASSFPMKVMVGTIFVQGGSKITIARLGLVSKGGYPCTAPPYYGMVSGIRAETVAQLTVTEVASRHYNRAGVYVTGPSANERSAGPWIHKNLLQQNRVGGLLLGFTAGAKVEHNRFYNNGRHGNGETAYGFGGVSNEPPLDTTVTCNLADYTVRKGIDFHAALGTTIIKNNHSIASGVAGIFVSGYADHLGGTVTIENNRVATMSPDITNGTHGLGASGTQAGVIGIWTYSKFTTPSSTVPTFVVRGNTIEDFTAASGTLMFAPFQLRSEAYSTGSTTVSRNTVNAGVINQFISSNDPLAPTGIPMPSGQQSFYVHLNTMSYQRFSEAGGRRFLALAQARGVSVVGNTFAAAGATGDQWDDAAIQGAEGCRLSPAQWVYGSAPTVCTVNTNVWRK